MITSAPEARGARTAVRRLARIATRVAIVIVLIPLVLVPLYLVVSPVSTLMIYTRLFSGPIDRRWVPLDAVAKPLVASVVMSEDGRFCEHVGVDWRELGRVLDRSGEPSRGASTIPMQTVKNLFLWTSRSYLRKGFEIPLALYADMIWPKRRMMEIYLNIAEWGPGIFGIEAASQHYFRRSAKDLSPGQAALLAAALPDPIGRNPAKASRHLQARARAVAAMARVAGDYLGCLYP